MKRLLAGTFCALFICGVLPAQSTSSQIGNLISGKKNKNAQQDPNAAADLSNVDKDKIVDSAVLGTAVVAICGKVWVPSRDPKKFPVCPDCQRIYESLPEGD